MASQFQTKLDQWTEWYSFNRNNSGSLEHKLQFLQRSNDMVLHLLHLANEELKASRGKTSDHLWLPTSLGIKGDVHSYS